MVLSSVLPVFDYPWKPGLQPAPKIVALNAWMQAATPPRAAPSTSTITRRWPTSGTGCAPELADDGVHPNEAGYRIMAGLAEQAIAAALKGR